MAETWLRFTAHIDWSVVKPVLWLRTVPASHHEAAFFHWELCLALHRCHVSGLLSLSCSKYLCEAWKGLRLLSCDRQVCSWVCVLDVEWRTEKSMIGGIRDSQAAGPALGISYLADILRAILLNISWNPLSVQQGHPRDCSKNLVCFWMNSHGIVHLCYWKRMCSWLKLAPCDLQGKNWVLFIARSHGLWEDYLPVALLNYLALRL